MKFDLFAWKEEANAKGKIQGVLRLRASEPGALYLAGHDADGEVFEALAGYGAEFEVEAPDALTWRFVGPKAARVFVRVVGNTSVKSQGEVYTNIDRMPDESGALAEVMRARRMLALEQREALREIREAARVLKAPKAPDPVPAPAPEPDPAPEPEPAPAPSGDGGAA